MDFDFGQNAEVTDISTVPEQFRPLYTEKEGGGHKLSDDASTKGAVEAILGLNRALKASRAEAKDAKGRNVDLSGLSDYGTTVDEITSGIATKIEELKGQVKSDGKAKINIEKIKEDLAKQHATDLTGKETRIEALTTQLYEMLVQSEAKSAISSEKGDADLLMPFVGKHVQVLEEDGKYQVFVVDSAGDRRYSGVTGQPMTINELVKEMKDNKKYGKLFESVAPKGTGAVPGSTGTHQITVKTEDLSPTQKIARGLANKAR